MLLQSFSLETGVTYVFAVHNAHYDGGQGRPPHAIAAKHTNLGFPSKVDRCLRIAQDLLLLMFDEIMSA
jgi:hypothetical protein